MVKTTYSYVLDTRLLIAWGGRGQVIGSHDIDLNLKNSERQVHG